MNGRITCEQDYLDHANILWDLKELDDSFKLFSDYGICAYVDLELRPHLHKYFEEWKCFSGSLSYPVPWGSKWSLSARNKFLYSKFKWIGRYGKLRRDLLKFLIKKIEQDLNNYADRTQ